MFKIFILTIAFFFACSYQASAKKAILCGKIIPACEMTDSTLKPVSVMLRKTWPISYYQLEQCMVDTTDFTFRFELEVDELSEYEFYINCFENIDTSDFLEVGLPLDFDVIEIMGDDEELNPFEDFWDMRQALYIEPSDSIHIIIDICNRDEFGWYSILYSGKGGAKNNHRDEFYQEYPISHGFDMPIKGAIYWENEHLKGGLKRLSAFVDSVSQAYYNMMMMNIAFVHINAMHTYIRASLYSDNPEVVQNRQLTRELYQFMDTIELKPEYLVSEQFRIFLDYYQEYISRIVTGLDVIPQGDLSYVMAESLYHGDVLKVYLFEKLMSDMQNFSKFFRMEEQYFNFLELFPDTKEAKVLTRVYMRHQQVAVGKVAPELVLKDSMHNNIKLSSLKGNVCIIISGCMWCSEWQQTVKNLRTNYGRKLVIISLTDNYEQRNPWFWKAFDYYVDNSLPAIKPYYMPFNAVSNYFIDKKGVIRFHSNNLKNVQGSINPLAKEQYNIFTRFNDFAKQHTAILLFTISALLFVIIGVVLVARYRQIKQQRQKQQLTSELKAIRSQLNPHFLFNSLNSIQNFINKANTEQANFHLSRFARLMRQVLDFSEKETISLYQEIEFARDYLELEALRYGFTLNIVIDEHCKIHDIEIPALITQPFIENAIVHAMADLGETGQLSLTFETQQNKLMISIVDNGKGFNTLAEKGFGLKGSLERIKLINARHQQEIALNITCNELGPGCNVRLSIPLDV